MFGPFLAAHQWSAEATGCFVLASTCQFGSLTPLALSSFYYSLITLTMWVFPTSNSTTDTLFLLITQIAIIGAFLKKFERWSDWWLFFWHGYKKLWKLRSLALGKKNLPTSQKNIDCVWSLTQYHLLFPRNIKLYLYNEHPWLSVSETKMSRF